MAEPLLVIRADAGLKMGTGHVMRCLALGQGWRDAGGKVVFITACSNEWLLQQLYREGFTVRRLERSYPDDGDWRVTGAIVADDPEGWLVLDGYHFDTYYQKRVKDAGYRLMVIDDTADLSHYYADIVLNQNIHAEDLEYSVQPYTRLLLGTNYVLLRREFLKWRGWKRNIPEVARKVLVTMGGSDPHNVALKVIEALQLAGVDGLEAVVVVGNPSNPHFQQLQTGVLGSRPPLRLESDVNNMAEIMAWADIAVSAGGSTCWEVLFMALPSIILVLAENQRPVAERLAAQGLAVNLGWYQCVSQSAITLAMTDLLVARSRRSEMAQRGRRLVDGEGSSRVVASLRDGVVRLRHVADGDCRLLWEWANDPQVRDLSFSSEPIPWVQHLQWFASKIRDPSCFMYIAMDEEGRPIGQIRYDVTGDAAVISVSIDHRFRRKGYGSMAIRLACQRLFHSSEAGLIHGYIKQGNEASCRAFFKVGFKDKGRATIQGHEALHLVLTPDALQ